ncbi:P-loop containing nucleoside triphosphate hydrolases superfamily protein [Wolffia australiana]
MEAPLAEELELLENAFLCEEPAEEYEEELQDASKSSYVAEECVEEPSQASGFAACRKRPLILDLDDLTAISYEEKRGRKCFPDVDDAVEDLMSLCPVKDKKNAGVVPVPGDVAVDLAPPDEVEERFLSRFASEIDGDCVPVTGPCGERVYAKMSALAAASGPKGLRIEQSGLLSEPIDALMERLEQEALRKALQESSAPSVDSVNVTKPDNEQLWVEKYAPRSFTELLSDEQTNRDVLLWLKQWDSCVFGSHIRATSDGVLSALRRHSTVAQHKKSYEKKNFRTQPSNSMADGDGSVLDSSDWKKLAEVNDGTPLKKVLLLCGPPGLGKTTLAHVAAKHCGYRVVEINASDDRSSATVESKILDAVQMNSVISDARPKCLVIDEIDGALGEGKGAVDVILKLVTAEKKLSSHRDSASDFSVGKAASKRRSTATLSRPVICICNDLYAPALRQLRQIAQVHMFVQPAASRVVNRLKYICHKEGLKTSSIALSALAEYTECDIRSCLNTLQFLNKKKEKLNILEISSQVVGRKDVSRSAFDVWKEVFQKKKAKQERKMMKECGLQGDFKFLDSLISNRGDYELTMDGIHENFLQIGFHDPLMQKTVGCLDVLGTSDCLLRYILRTQKMSLQVYQPGNAIAINRLIAQAERPNIEWPKSFYRYRGTLVEKKDLVKTWLNGISPSISRHLSTEGFVQDVVSPLLQILSPKNLRPVALHLLSETEKEELFQLVDTMVSYSITYKNQPKADATAQAHLKYGSAAEVPAAGFAFDPPLDELVNFQGHVLVRPGLALAIKQIVVHEVEKQRILRSSGPARLAGEDGDTRRIDATHLGTRPPSSSSSSSFAGPVGQRKNKGAPPAMGLGKFASTTGGVPKKVQKDSRKPRRSENFFDRFRKASKERKTDDDISEAQTDDTGRRRRPLLFKYNEGFTNAVKRPVRLRELLM